MEWLKAESTVGNVLLEICFLFRSLQDVGFLDAPGDLSDRLLSGRDPSLALNFSNMDLGSLPIDLLVVVRSCTKESNSSLSLTNESNSSIGDCVAAAKLFPVRLNLPGPKDERSLEMASIAWLAPTRASINEVGEVNAAAAAACTAGEVHADLHRLGVEVTAAALAAAAATAVDELHEDLDFLGLTLALALSSGPNEALRPFLGLGEDFDFRRSSLDSERAILQAPSRGPKEDDRLFFILLLNNAFRASRDPSLGLSVSFKGPVGVCRFDFLEERDASEPG